MSWPLSKQKPTRSLSVDFQSLAERQVGPLRIIDAALISGVSVVSRAAYPQTTWKPGRSRARKSGPRFRLTFP